MATPVNATGLPVPQIKPVALPQDMTLGRGEPPTGERTTITVQHDLESAFLAGTKTNVTSSWLAWAQYDRAAQELEVAFVDGHRVTVEDISEGEAGGFYNAPSKGGWYHDVVIGPNYKKGDPSTAAKRWR